MWLDIVFVIAGIALVLFFAGRLVTGTLGFARGFGISAFVVSVIFLGFDPENLAVGAVGTYEGATGIAIGTIVGSAMVAIALAFGVTALIIPLRFEQAPRQILAVPILAVLLMAALAWDGQLSRIDGIGLLASYVAAIAYLIWLSRRGIDIRGIGLGKKTERAEGIGRAKVIGLFILSLAMIITGSELLVHGAASIIEQFGLSQTFIGMTAVALAISIEEIARELPAAMRGHPEISFGNVAGSVLTFFLFNAGIIALIRPLEVGPATMQFYLPITIATVVLISAFLFFGRLSRWAGALLVLLYIGFVTGGYLLYGANPASGAERGEQGRQSDRGAHILRINFPRSDLNVRIGNVPVSAELTLTSWYGFWPMPDGTMRLMGDTVVLESELDGVLNEIRQQGLRITAIHNHLANESPNILYVHIAGRGSGAALARKAKAVLARTGTPMTETEEKENSSSVDWSSVVAILGEPDEREGDLIEYVFPRAEQLSMRGRKMPSTQALETAPEIKLQMLEEGHAITYGEMVLVADEVDPVFRTLTEHGKKVTAVHNHMLFEEPRLFFMHWWGVGEPQKLATGLRAALDNMNIRQGTAD